MSNYPCGLPTAFRFIISLVAWLFIGTAVAVLLALTACTTLETRWCPDENTGQPRPCDGRN